MHQAISTLRRLTARHPIALSVALIGLVAVCARLIMFDRAPVFIMKDSQSYFLPGWDLANGRDFDLELRRTPLYPWLIAAALRTFGESLGSIALVQHVLGVGTALATFWAGRLAFGRGVGLFAGLLTAISGPLLIFEHYVMPEALFTFLLVVGSGCLLQGMRTPHLLWFALGGAGLAAAALTRPAAQLVLLALPAVMLVMRVPLRMVLLRAGVASAAFAAVTIPWMLEVQREYGVFASGATLGEPLIFRTVHQDRGFELPDPALTPYADPVKNQARKTVIEMAARRANPSDMLHRIRRDYRLSRPDADAILRDVAIEIIRMDPLYYVESTVRLTAQVLLGRHEALNFAWTTRRDRAGDDTLENWQSVPRIRHLVQPATDAQRAAYDLVDRLVNLFQPSRVSPVLLLLAILGVIGCARRPDWRAGLLLAFVPVALVLTATLVSGGVFRFRYPADPFLYVLAVAGTVTVYQGTVAAVARRRAQRDSAVPVPSAAGVKSP